MPMPLDEADEDVYFVNELFTLREAGVTNEQPLNFHNAYSNSSVENSYLNEDSNNQLFRADQSEIDDTFMSTLQVESSPSYQELIQMTTSSPTKTSAGQFDHITVMTNLEQERQLDREIPISKISEGEVFTVPNATSILQIYPPSAITEQVQQSVPAMNMTPTTEILIQPEIQQHPQTSTADSIHSKMAMPNTFSILSHGYNSKKPTDIPINDEGLTVRQHLQQQQQQNQQHRIHMQQHQLGMQDKNQEEYIGDYTTMVSSADDLMMSTASIVTNMPANVPATAVSMGMPVNNVTGIVQMGHHYNAQQMLDGKQDLYMNRYREMEIMNVHQMQGPSHSQKPLMQCSTTDIHELALQRAAAVYHQVKAQTYAQTARVRGARNTNSEPVGRKRAPSRKRNHSFNASQVRVTMLGAHSEPASQQIITESDQALPIHGISCPPKKRHLERADAGIGTGNSQKNNGQGQATHFICTNHKVTPVDLSQTIEDCFKSGIGFDPPNVQNPYADSIDENSFVITELSSETLMAEHGSPNALTLSTISTGQSGNVAPAGHSPNAVPVGQGHIVVSVGQGKNLVPLGQGSSIAPVVKGQSILPAGQCHSAAPVGQSQTVVHVAHGQSSVSNGQSQGPSSVGQGQGVMPTRQGQRLMSAVQDQGLVTGPQGMVSVREAQNIVRTGQAQNAIRTGPSSNMGRVRQGTNVVRTGQGPGVRTVGHGLNVGGAGKDVNVTTAGQGVNEVPTKQGTNTVPAGQGPSSVTAGRSLNAVPSSSSLSVASAGQGLGAVINRQSSSAVPIADDVGVLPNGQGANASSGQNLNVAPAGSSVVSAHSLMLPGNVCRAVEPSVETVAHVEAGSHTAQIPEFEIYVRKLYFMKRMVKALVFKNGALCDEVSRLNQRIVTVMEERKILAKRLQHFERNRIRRIQTKLKKAAAQAAKAVESRTTATPLITEVEAEGLPVGDADIEESDDSDKTLSSSGVATPTTSASMSRVETPEPAVRSQEVRQIVNNVNVQDAGKNSSRSAVRRQLLAKRISADRKDKETS